MSRRNTRAAKALRRDGRRPIPAHTEGSDWETRQWFPGPHEHAQCGRVQCEADAEWGMDVDRPGPHFGRMVMACEDHKRLARAELSVIPVELQEAMAGTCPHCASGMSHP